MVVLRATQKVMRTLPLSAAESDASDNALGDWYVNRILIGRQPLLLLVSSKSRLSLLAPARDLKTLPLRLAEMVGERLRRLGVHAHIVASEVAATASVSVGKTLDRSVIGQLVDFAKALAYYLPVDGWDEAMLRATEERLAETPCRASRPFSEVIFPRQTAIQLLEITWPASSTRN
jgi:hypothetical protein